MSHNYAFKSHPHPSNPHICPSLETGTTTTGTTTSATTVARDPVVDPGTEIVVVEADEEGATVRKKTTTPVTHAAITRPLPRTIA